MGSEGLLLIETIMHCNFFLRYVFRSRPTSTRFPLLRSCHKTFHNVLFRWNPKPAKYRFSLSLVVLPATATNPDRHISINKIYFFISWTTINFITKIAFNSRIGGIKQLNYYEDYVNNVNFTLCGLQNSSEQ